MPDSPAPTPEGTPAALLDAAIRLFGQKGFAATSTREIAALARTNVASIAYHFGGKDGLRMACGAEFARRIQAGVAPVDPVAASAAPAEAGRMLEAVLRRMVTFLFSDTAQDSVAFMLREAAEQGPVVEAVYVALIDPVHRHLCGLWQSATGQPAESEAVRLRVFSLVGQALYFRLASPIVCRRMDWAAIGPDQVRSLADILVGNLHVLLSEARR
jgi:AcrR family transcriptional regulator